MKSFQGENAQDLYLPELFALRNIGDRIDVRGHQTVEILNATTEVLHPWNPCILIPARRWNPWLALSEGLWILAGRDDVAALKPYNAHIVDYSDDNVHLYGAYGKRIYSQIDPLIERLRKDPNDRRAVLQIWDTNEGLTPSNFVHNDLVTNSKDPPCNNMVYLKLRNNRLHMTVINRSNDIHFGLFAVNLPTFSMLQQYIAARLGVLQGTQTHFSNSLHYYTDDKRAKAITDRMFTSGAHIENYPSHSLMFHDLTRLAGGHHNFASWCTMALEDKELGVGDNGMEFLRFARAFLKMYRERDWKPDLLDQQYADWIKAGDIFVQEVWNAR